MVGAVDIDLLAFPGANRVLLSATDPARANPSVTIDTYQDRIRVIRLI
jgi:hypothetical protein